MKTRTRRHAINLASPSNRGLRRSVENAENRAAAGQVTWLERDGEVRAVIVPAQDWHDPATCCCKNCPWKGNHG